MRKYISKILTVVGLSVFVGITGGCEKELDFKYQDIDPILVIEGVLTQQGAKVALTHTTPMDEPMNRTKLSDAEVNLLDITTGRDYKLMIDDDGNFSGEYRGEVDHEYQLRVKRLGNEYISRSKFRECVDFKDMAFSWIQMPYDYVAVLQVTFTDNAATNDDCYWVRLYRNGEAYQWAVLNDAHSSGGIVNKVFMTTRKDLDEEDEDDRLEKGDIVTATITPVSREFHDYLEALEVGNSNGPRMFEGNFCLGYFLASPVVEKSIVFDPDSF